MEEHGRKKNHHAKSNRRKKHGTKLLLAVAPSLPLYSMLYSHLTTAFLQLKNKHTRWRHLCFFLVWNCWKLKQVETKLKLQHVKSQSQMKNMNVHKKSWGNRNSARVLKNPYIWQPWYTGERRVPSLHYTVLQRFGGFVSRFACVQTMPMGHGLHHTWKCFFL